MEAIFPILSVVIAIVAVTIGTAVHYRQLAKMRESWEVAARRLGLDAAPKQLRITGLRRGHLVEVGGFAGKGSATTYMVHGIPQHVTIGAESLRSSVGKIFSGEDLQVGDDPFDQHVLVRSQTGRDVETLALLSSEVRAAIREAVNDHGASIEHGYVVLRRGGVVSDPGKLEADVEMLVRLAGLIGTQARKHPGAALAQIANEDPSPKVRMKALETMVVRFFADSPFVQKACRVALNDTSPAIRLRAALVLDAEGLPTLRKLLKIDVGHESVRAAALDRLCDRVERAEGIELLKVALAAKSTTVRVAAAARLTKMSAPELVAALEQAALDSIPQEDITVYANALANTGSPDAERPLLALLDLEIGPLRVAVSRGLAKLGTRRAVEKLLPLTQGITLDADVKREARRAIDAIQSRLAGAGAGQLAISEDPDAGALSEAEKPGGLALAKKQTT